MTEPDGMTAACEGQNADFVNGFNAGLMFSTAPDPAPLDVERLARVLAQLGNPDDGWDDGIDAYAADIARTYAEDRP